MLDRLLSVREWPVSYARAVQAAAATDRTGFAFAAGYQAALRALVPALPHEGLVSLAASEIGGAHPRAIATTLVDAGDGGLRMHGRKSFATQGDQASVFLVLASAGTSADGRARLRVVQVARGAPGLVIEPAPPTPFCPEIGHARLTLRDVPVDASDLVDGDGWTDLVKPFRTIEDVHVHGAVLAYVLGVSERFAWPHELREPLAALVAAFAALAARDPADAATHIALAGTISLARSTLAAQAAAWARVEADERARWWRDQPLLDVAAQARAARTQAAWAAK
jgi:acyl-CoA dehydrogenase